MNKIPSPTELEMNLIVCHQSWDPGCTQVSSGALEKDLLMEPCTDMERHGGDGEHSAGQMHIWPTFVWKGQSWNHIYAPLSNTHPRWRELGPFVLRSGLCSSEPNPQWKFGKLLSLEWQLLANVYDIQSPEFRIVQTFQAKASTFPSELFWTVDVLTY